MLDGGRAVLGVARLVLALQQEANDLGEEEAQREADHDTSKTLVVPSGVFPKPRGEDVSRTVGGTTIPLPIADSGSRRRAGKLRRGNLRIEEQRAGDVAQRVSNESTGSIDRLLGIAGSVGSSQANALDPSGGEEVDQVETKDSAASLFQLPATKKKS